MRLGLFVISLLVIAFLLAPNGAAQSAEAPHPSSEHTLLYLHGTGDDEYNVFMNTLEQDGNDNALGAGTCNGALIGSLPVVGAPPIDPDDPTYEGEPADLLYTVTLNPALHAPITLEDEGEAVLLLHLGASSCDSADDPLEVSFVIEAGDVRVAQSAVVPYTWSAGAPYPVLEISAPLLVDAIGTDAELVMTINMEGTFNGVVFIGVSEAQGRSYLELPITSPPPAIADEEAGGITIDEPVLFHEFTNLTDASGTHQITWLQAPDEADLRLEWLDSNATGLVTVRIHDAAGLIYEGLLFDSDSDLTDGVFGSPGTWNITVELEDVTGAFTLALHPHDPDSETPEHPDDHGDDDHHDEEEESRGIPAPGIAVVLVTLGAVMALRRR